jgi:tagatose-6-phosphate ketose/aldose isomerase
MSTESLVEAEWLRSLASRQPKAAEFLAKSPAEQSRLGYAHTLREICQQPSTWLQTGSLMRASASILKPIIAGIHGLTLTGSGSSEYAGDCVRLPLRAELGVDTEAIGAGVLLSYGAKALPPGKPGLMVSFARSGDSPESVGALAWMLQSQPELRHLVLTCNALGSLARNYRNDPRVTIITLDEVTNDKSLVMTSSFTNLVLAARFLGFLDRPDRYLDICEQLSRTATEFIQRHFGTLADVAAKPFNRLMFLASGARFAGTREAALKMLEMTGGSVTSVCETYLGVRHGPMSYVHDDTLVVAFLSSDPNLRAYEVDLLNEFDQKNLGLLKLIVGENIPKEVVRPQDIALESEGLAKLGDDNCGIIDVLTGQLLAFFRCLEAGLRPDSPSEGGVINRVVQKFALHLPQA